MAEARARSTHAPAAPRPHSPLGTACAPQVNEVFGVQRYGAPKDPFLSSYSYDGALPCRAEWHRAVLSVPFRVSATSIDIYIYIYIYIKRDREGEREREHYICAGRIGSLSDIPIKEMFGGGDPRFTSLVIMA